MDGNEADKSTKAFSDILYERYKSLARVKNLFGFFRLYSACNIPCAARQLYNIYNRRYKYCADVDKTSFWPGFIDPSDLFYITYKRYSSIGLIINIKLIIE